jgi:hypothetical protein
MTRSQLVEALRKLPEDELYNLIALAAAETGVAMKLTLLERIHEVQSATNWCLLHNKCGSHCNNCYGSGYIQEAVMTIDDPN